MNDSPHQGHVYFNCLRNLILKSGLPSVLLPTLPMSPKIYLKRVCKGSVSADLNADLRIFYLMVFSEIQDKAERNSGRNGREQT